MKKVPKYLMPSHTTDDSTEAGIVIGAMIQRVAAMADSGFPDKALMMLNRMRTNTDAERNARGVCLLRLGRIEESLRQLRSLVLRTNCTWMRPELPVIYRANLCTALILAGHLVGASELLASIDEQHHPSVMRLKQTMGHWKKRLSFWQRIQWELGLEPEVSVILDFKPGDFLDPTEEPSNAIVTSNVASPVELPDGVTLSSRMHAF